MLVNVPPQIVQKAGEKATLAAPSITTRPRARYFCGILVFCLCVFIVSAHVCIHVCFAEQLIPKTSSSALTSNARRRYLNYLVSLAMHTYSPVVWALTADCLLPLSLQISASRHLPTPAPWSAFCAGGCCCTMVIVGGS